MTKFSCKLLDNFKVIDTHGRTGSDMTTFSVIIIIIIIETTHLFPFIIFFLP